MSPDKQVLRPDEDLSANNLLGRRREQEQEVGTRQRGLKGSGGNTIKPATVIGD